MSDVTRILSQIEQGEDSVSPISLFTPFEVLKLPAMKITRANNPITLVVTVLTAGFLSACGKKEAAPLPRLRAFGHRREPASARGNTQLGI